MELYCKDCKYVYEAPRCPSCGSKHGTPARGGDLCFLTEKEQIWSGMLSDVLEQNGIAHIRKNLLGAGLTVSIGLGFERVSFFVEYKDLARAREIVEELFPDGDADGQ